MLMMNDADVDGFIYKFAMTYYSNLEDTRVAMRTITKWLNINADRRYLTIINNVP